MQQQEAEGTRESGHSGMPQASINVNGKGVEGLPLGPSLRCPSTLLTESSHLGSGASLDSAPRANIGHWRVRSDDVDQTVRVATRTPKDYDRAFVGEKA